MSKFLWLQEVYPSVDPDYNLDSCSIIINSDEILKICPSDREHEWLSCIIHFKNGETVEISEEMNTIMDMLERPQSS